MPDPDPVVRAIGDLRGGGKKSASKQPKLVQMHWLWAVTAPNCTEICSQFHLNEMFFSITVAEQLGAASRRRRNPGFFSIWDKFCRFTGSLPRSSKAELDPSVMATVCQFRSSPDLPDQNFSPIFFFKKTLACIWKA